MRDRAAPLLVLLLLGLCGCDGPLEGRLADARELQGEGRFGASIPPLRAVLEERPAHPEASYRLGRALLEVGRVTPGLVHLARAAQRTDAEVSLDAQEWLAAGLLRSQNALEAVRVSTRLLERDPGRSRALWIRGHAYAASNAHAEALADVERFLDAEPDSLEAHALRASLLADLGRLELAEQVSTQLVERAAERPALVAWGACLVLARFFAAVREDLERAIATLDACRERNGPEPEGMRAGAALLLHHGAAAAAESLVRRGLEANPDSLPLREALANRLAQRGDIDGALALLREATAKGDGNSWLSLARLQQQWGRVADARQSLEEAVGLLTDRGRPALATTFQLALLLLELGELDEAQRVAAQLSEPIYRDLVDARLAMARGDPAAAEPLLRRSLERWPNNPAARMAAADVAIQLNDEERALSELREAARLGSQLNDAALQLAGLYLQRAEYSPALEFAARHREAHGVGDGRAHRIAVRAASALGDDALARRWLRELDDYPELQEVADEERARLRGAVAED